MDHETRRQQLTEHDWGVIIDTAPHETYTGHHVQDLYQAHNSDPLRRKCGIAIFSEGWGLYNETLMYETGFLRDHRTHLRQLQLRLWRIARVLYDEGLNRHAEIDGSATERGYRIGH